MKKILIIGLIMMLTACQYSIQPDNPDDEIPVEGDEIVLPESFSWVDEGVVLSAQDQMNLGSCSIFAATSILESKIAIETGNLYNLSEQHYIMGSDNFSATSGSTPEPALNFFIEFGIVLEENFPYSVTDAKAKTESVETPMDYLFEYEVGYSVINDIPEEDRVEHLKEIIYTHGPVATLMVFYEDFDAYRSGIYVNDESQPERGGHWITIVGWVDDDTVLNGGYWIIKNSFGPSWGENGFARIAYNDNTRLNDFHFYYLIDTSDNDE